MALHPGARERNFPEEAPVAWDPIRRDLEANQDWYRDLVDHSQDLLSVHDLDGRILSVNPVPARLLGYSVKEMLQKHLRDFIDPRYLPQHDAYLQEIKRTGASSGLVAVMARSGEQRIWEYHNTLRTEGVGTPIVRGIAHDVTDRVRAEQALRRTNEKLRQTAREQELLLDGLTLFRTLLDQSNDAIEVVNPDTLRLLDVNERACIELGYSRDELLSRTVPDIDPEVDQISCARMVEQLRESGFAIKESVHRRKDGTTFPVEVSLRCVRLDREYVVVVSRDITARKKRDERLREFERVVEHLADMVTVVDRNYRYVLANRAFLKQRGMTKEQVLGRTVAEVLNPGVFETEIQKRLDECLQRKVVTYDLAYEYPGIGRRDLFITYLPVEGSTGIDRVACVLRDVTEQKRAEAALRESEARERASAKEMKAVLDSVPVAVCIAHDAECLRITGNPAAYEQMRVPADANLSANLSMKAAFGKRPTFRLFEAGVEVSPDRLPMQQAATTGKPVYGRALTMVFEDGAEREEVVNAVPLLDEAGRVRGAVGASLDLTELKRAEKALRESEHRFRTVYERSPFGISLVDSLTGKLLQVNPKFCEITGRAEEELLRSDVTSITHPDDVGRDIESLQQLAEEKLSSYEMEKRYLRPDGSVRWVRLVVTPMWSKGESRRWEMGLVEDITDRKRAEEAIATLLHVPTDGSESFFTSMAVQLAKCLEADYTIIGEIVEHQDGKVRTIGVCGQGVIADNFTRDLADTPCDVVVQQGAASYVSGVTNIFPKDVLLKQMKVEGYTGRSLLDSQGRIIGLMVALYCRPLTNANFAKMILELFSTRIAAEIERKRTEVALRQSEERFRVAIKHSPIAVFSQDRELRYTWSYNSQLPWSSNEKVGKTPSELFAPAEAARIAEVRLRVLETGVGVRHEVQVTCRGKKQYLDTTIEPLFNAAGSVIGLTGASMDITELRETGEALREAKRKLTEEKLYLEQEIDTELGFGEIIGQSKALQAIMEHVGKVASSDATVLLLGETGTGKELVARAIHRLSRRAHNSFIKMNCAAIPTGLLESELFGNEKGAFTGAVSKKLGRLELADKGTLFLDEIGEISLGLQPKLLRVLQDQEFERLGGTHTIKVDFRLIAATNRDLADGVRENEFRSDLYYRLNVFPIRVPPLRERREDIRLLVEHFVQKCARRMNKSIVSIPKKTLDVLMEWEWPGNVRELENFIERSVILTQGSVLVSPLSELQPSASYSDKTNDTLEATEREHILRALRESHGQIGGPRGAAHRLGLKRTTLQSKLKHLGINPKTLTER